MTAAEFAIFFPLVSILALAKRLGMLGGAVCPIRRSFVFPGLAMKYACLVYHEEKKLAALSDAELAAIVAECGAWVDDLVEGGHHVFSAALQAVRTATTVRHRDGEFLMTDGPFAETKEFLGGLTIIEARDLNEAMQLTARFPAARIGTVELRPLLDPGVALTDPLDQKIGRAMAGSKW
jgi:hypothetical protein